MQDRFCEYENGAYYCVIGDWGAVSSLDDYPGELRQITDTEYSIAVDYGYTYDPMDVDGIAEQQAWGTVTYYIAFDGEAYHITDAEFVRNEAEEAATAGSTSGHKYTEDQAYNAVVEYCTESYGLKDVDPSYYYFYQDEENQSEGTACVVYRSYTGTLTTYQVNLDTGMATGSTYVPNMDITEEEDPVDMSVYMDDLSAYIE